MPDAPIVPLLLVFAFFLLTGPAAGAVVSFDNPAVTVHPGEVATINLILDTAPEGFSGYRVVISMADPARGEVSAVALPDWAEVSEITGTPGPEARITAVDLGSEVEKGATGILLATISVKGLSPGTTGILLSDPVFTNEDGFDSNPILADASLTVTTGTTTTMTEPDTLVTTTTTTPGEPSLTTPATAGSSGHGGGSGGSGSGSYLLLTPATTPAVQTSVPETLPTGLPETTPAPGLPGTPPGESPANSSDPAQPASDRREIPLLTVPALLLLAGAIIMLGRKMR